MSVKKLCWDEKYSAVPIRRAYYQGLSSSIRELELIVVTVDDVVALVFPFNRSLADEYHVTIPARARSEFFQTRELVHY